MFDILDSQCIALSPNIFVDFNYFLNYYPFMFLNQICSKEQSNLWYKEVELFFCSLECNLKLEIYFDS